MTCILPTHKDAASNLGRFTEAINATWPPTDVQTCAVHLIRSLLRFVSCKERRSVAAAVKHIYTAVNEDAILAALEAFEASGMGRKYPATAAAWRATWDRFIPFLEFAPAVRKASCTTNTIESLNYQLRKIIKNRGHFPHDPAVVELLWLSICNIEDKRARQRAKADSRVEASQHGKLIEGTTTQG